MKKNILVTVLSILVITSAIIPQKLASQNKFNKDTLLVAAREIMADTHYCGFVTIDSTGQPQTRTLNPFPANDELITWFATSRTSRKVRQIKNNPNVCVYYANHQTAKGYVNITGTATVIDDKELLVKMKRDYWNGIPGWQDKFVLIKVVPKTLEVVNYHHGLNNDPDTFKAPTMDF